MGFFIKLFLYLPGLVRPILTWLHEERLQVLVFTAGCPLSLGHLPKARPQQQRRATVFCHHSGPVLHVSCLNVQPSLTKSALMRLLV